MDETRPPKPERTERAPDPARSTPISVAPERRKLFLIAGGAVAGLLLLGAVLIIAGTGGTALKGVPGLPKLPTLVDAKPTETEIFEAFQRRLKQDCSIRALAVSGNRAAAFSGLFGGLARYENGACVHEALGIRSTMRLLEVKNVQCSGPSSGYDCTFMIRASFKQDPPTPLFARMFGDMETRGQAVVWKEDGEWQVRPVKPGSR